MAPISQQIAQMVDVLPESDQSLAYELIKKLILAWDPDFTKVTPSEAAEIYQSELEYAAGETISHNDVNWD